MRKSFSSSGEAVDYFVQELMARGFEIETKDKVKAYTSHGKYIYMDRVITASKEVYLIKCRMQGRWIPKDSKDVSDFGKMMDERYKFMIRTFGNGDPSISGVNEDTILELLQMEEQDYTPYLVTIFPKTGEILWCHVRDAYNMVMRYGALPQTSFQGLTGQTFCSIPTGWMKPWGELKVSPPLVIEDSNLT
jgi:hypothetical protein